MAFYDSVPQGVMHRGFLHKYANDAATRFMKQVFDVETSLDMLIDFYEKQSEVEDEIS